MLNIDTNHWPLVLFEFAGKQSLVDHQNMLEAWDQLFTRQQKFVAVRLFLDDESVNHSREIGQLTLDWMEKGARDQIKTWVEAMLFITPDVSYARMKNRNVERVFGVPGAIFNNVCDANQWLAENIQQPLYIPDNSVQVAPE